MKLKSLKKRNLIVTVMSLIDGGIFGLILYLIWEDLSINVTLGSNMYFMMIYIVTSIIATCVHTYRVWYKYTGQDAS